MFSVCDSFDLYTFSKRFYSTVCYFCIYTFFLYFFYFFGKSNCDQIVFLKYNFQMHDFEKYEAGQKKFNNFLNAYALSIPSNLERKTS